MIRAECQKMQKMLNTHKTALALHLLKFIVFNLI